MAMQLAKAATHKNQNLLRDCAAGLNHLYNYHCESSTENFA